MSDAAHQADLELVRRAVAGDADARDRLAVRLGCVGRMLAARNQRFGGQLDHDDLADVTQEVVTRVLQKLADYSGLAALESWVFAFCDGELRNAIRRKRRLRVRAEDVALAGAAEAAADPLEDIHLCLQQLAGEDLQMVRWKHFEDLTLDEIAARASRNLNTVKSRYYRALMQLRRCLEQRAAQGER